MNPVRAVPTAPIVPLPLFVHFWIKKWIRIFLPRGSSLLRRAVYRKSQIGDLVLYCLHLSEKLRQAWDGRLLLTRVEYLLGCHTLIFEVWGG